MRYKSYLTRMQIPRLRLRLSQGGWEIASVWIFCEVLLTGQQIGVVKVLTRTLS